MAAKDILMPICRPWTERIFAGEKPFEFRNRIGTYWGSGSRIFIYESKRSNGAGMVVGDAVIDEITPIPMNAIGPPRFLLRHWAERNRPDLIPLLDELGDYELPNYKKGTILRYLENPELLRDAMRTGEWVRMDESNEKVLCACEDWLHYIGLTDAYGWYWYKYALKLSRIQRYTVPKPLAVFGIARAPQSWCYTKGV